MAVQKSKNTKRFFKNINNLNYYKKVYKNKPSTLLIKGKLLDSVSLYKHL